MPSRGACRARAHRRPAAVGDSGAAEYDSLSNDRSLTTSALRELVADSAAPEALRQQAMQGLVVSLRPPSSPWSSPLWPAVVGLGLVVLFALLGGTAVFSRTMWYGHVSSRGRSS